MQDRSGGRAEGVALPLRHRLFGDRVLSIPDDGGRDPRGPHVLPSPGHSSYCLRVAGISVSVRASDPAAPFECSGASRAFLVEEGDGHPPDLVLDVEWAEPSADPEGVPLFDSGGVWRAFRTERETVWRFHDPRGGPQPYKEARLLQNGGRGLVRLDPRACPAGEPVDPLQYPLDELLFQRLLGERGGVELHAVGVVAPSGRGYVFAGQSGDGKTTTARMWQEAVGAAVLSDDRIVLTPDAAGRWLMHGTPWHGEAELALPASAPVDAVFVLGRGTQNELSPLGSARAVAALLARSFPAFYDAARTGALVSQLERLVTSVPCRHFAFVPGRDAVYHVLHGAP